MTHTVHPYGHRLGIIRDWKSRWFATSGAQYRKNLKIDTTIRQFLKKRLRGMYVTSIEMERTAVGDDLKVIIFTSRPGMVIGRSGEGSTQLLKDINKNLRRLKLGAYPKVRIDIKEVKSPESQAPVVAQMVAEGLEKRMPHRRILKQTVEKVMANRDVKGVRISLSGRLGGADMARKEELKKGRIPLQTFRADIDYTHYEVVLGYGVIGIKVWIYRGEIFDKENK